METRTHLYHPPTRTSDTEGSPDSSAMTRLTPDSESEDSELDIDMGMGEEGESFKLQRLGTDAEKGGVHDDEGLLDEDEDEEEDEYPTPGRRRGASVSTIQSYQLYTPDEERAVVRKFDRKLVLFLALLYMLSFLDRSNIGNAKIAGLDIDLDLDSARYEWVITAFYLAYISFEWMSLLWKIVPAHIYVTLIVLSWGIVASLQSVATSFVGLLVLRTLLGIGEAGFTGIPFYLSFFFKREELALRNGYFVSAAPLATSFASTLAWVIIKLGSNGPIAPWRLLFLLEGFPSVLVAVIAWHTIPDSPESAHYLTRREKKVARLRLRKDKDPSSAPGKKGLNVREMLSTIVDPKTYLTAFMFFFTNMAFSSLPVFLPTIIHEMGHTVLISQALSAPPYLMSFFIVILTAYLSDRLQNRSYFVIFHALLSASGYALMALSSHYNLGTWWRYAAIYPAAIGFFSVITIIVTWAINNQESESKQGTGFAMLQLIGQCGPLVGTRLYPEEEAPYYVRGMTVCACAMGVVAVLSIVLRLYLGALNERGKREEGFVGEAGEGLVGRRAGKRGGKHRKPFVYML
ncbi:related to nicotinamide mononucleotide permease [Rhynchosporium secalis]|uniref:Related to nicotinamide mononucleotide permease n=1 Tax=Rhynchosporium secalis TaxID=38038 RepID=A0A1E1LZS6_RHYSE|nr:related to nicotinamide mononucleotide permease [Rhynchosporium secalis]